MLAFLRIVWRFVRYLKPVWDKLLFLLALGQCGTAVRTVAVACTAKVVDLGLQAGNARAFYWWGGLVVALLVVSILQTYLAATARLYIKMRVDLRMKRDVFERLQQLSLRFQEARPVGENMFRVNYDTTAATDIAASTVPEGIENILNLITMGGVAFLLDPLLAGVIAIYLLSYYVYSHCVGTYWVRHNRRLRARAQDALAALQESLSAFCLSKALSRERSDRRRYFGRLALVLRSQLGFGISWSALNNGTLALQNILLQLAWVVMCGWFVVTERMTVGEYLAAAGLIQLTTTPFQALTLMIQRLRMNAVPGERLIETLDAHPEIADLPKARALDDVVGRLSFENVSFRYSPDGPEVIRNLSFAVEPGRKLAIVGPSGAGKSSIFNLLMRYYDPTAGRVLVEGMDLRSVKLESYRRHIAVVLQDNFLYSATIRDNILFGNPDASEAALDEAVERAGLPDLLRRLPQGLDTALKEGGNLSAGQKQRIALARAFVRDPKLLFLDEATASLDPVTEAEILAQLRLLEKGRTRIVISHNIASTRDADEILVMDQGRLVQRGAHADLLAHDGLYRRMWAAEERKGAGKHPAHRSPAVGTPS